MSYSCVYIGTSRYHQLIERMQNLMEIEILDHSKIVPSDCGYDIYLIEYHEANISDLELIQGAYIMLLTEDMIGPKREALALRVSPYHVSDILFGSGDFEAFRMRFEGNIGNLIFKTFMDKMHMEAVITDDQSHIIYTNEAFSDETGYDSVIGMKPSILKSGFHSLMFYNNLYHTIKSGMRWEGKLKNKRKDGTMFYEDAAIFPLEVFGRQYYGKIGYNTTKHDQLMDETEQSLKMAEALQRSLISEDVYDEKIIIRGKYIPLTNVSGDIYNIYRMNDYIYSVIVADVAGHGVGSALLSTSIIAICNELVRKQYMPDVFLQKLNDRVMNLLHNQDLSSVTYFTAAYVVVDTKAQKIHYANCGHPQMYHFNDTYFNSISAINFSIGMFSDVAFEYNTCDYKPGDRLLIYTDGLVEMGQNITEGQQLLEAQLHTYRALESKPSLVEYLEKQSIQKMEPEANDDITIIGIDLL